MSLFLRIGLTKFRVTRSTQLLASLLSVHGPVTIASTRFIATTFPVRKKETFDVTFVRENGEKVNAVGKVGDSLLDVIINNHLDFDGFGACEGTLACSTCHLIFKPEDFKRLKETPSDEELDMLDLAYGLCETNREQDWVSGAFEKRRRKEIVEQLLEEDTKRTAKEATVHAGCPSENVPEPTGECGAPCYDAQTL